ncbi:uncharacterized protein LOC126772972 [Nymphalis io]|uniref:uncharacterized protein LOC126772972 n=1 Tax=Inachis io TaxID=171585 RepID=UPI002166D778|nr:uncharacterized protein LOC126772972 [Nymphalis io]
MLSWLNKLKDDTESEKSDETPADNYLFVALIDVVFTDGSKRTCTGTIIHDNVVITAAHCFSIDDSMQPELTASFVVIGTKKMFETGYEQYLPIERIITHPKYIGWTADLALVFTFAGMMSDKPGRVVRLASEKTNTDSEVTVFSWGQCKDDKGWGTDRPETVTKTETPYEASLSDDEKLDDVNNQKETEKKHKVTSINEDDQYMDAKSSRHLPKYSQDHNIGLRQQKKKRKFSIKKRKPRKKEVPITVARAFTTRITLHKSVSSVEENRNRHRKQTYNNVPEFESKEYQISREKQTRNRHRKQTYNNVPEFESKEYQISREKQTRNRHRKQTYNNVPEFESKEYQISREKQTKYPYNAYKKSAVADKRMHRRRAYSMKYYYRDNWHRKMGDQKNKLTVDVFSFVNTQTCNKLVEKSMPSIYKIKNHNQVLCYSSEDHYIDEEDSGAPAMRQGRLVAVTVGGIDLDGARVAIGMRIICFCSWIAENLPKGGNRIQCCKNCCEVKDNEHREMKDNLRYVYRMKPRESKPIAYFRLT